MTIARRLLAQGLGSVFLLALVLNSGMKAERLTGDNVAIPLEQQHCVQGPPYRTVIAMCIAPSRGLPGNAMH